MGAGLLVLVGVAVLGFVILSAGPRPGGPTLTPAQVDALFDPPLAGFRINPDAVDGAIAAPEGCPSVAPALETATSTQLLAGPTGQGSVLAYPDPVTAVAGYRVLKEALGCSASGARPVGDGVEGVGSWYVYRSRAGSGVGMSTAVLQHGNVVVVLYLRDQAAGEALLDEFAARVGG